MHPDAPIGTEPSLLVSAPEAAKLLGIGVRLLWTMTNRGEIPHVRLGRRVLYAREDLAAFIEDQRRLGMGRRRAG